MASRTISTIIPLTMTFIAISSVMGPVNGRLRERRDKAIAGNKGLDREIEQLRNVVGEGKRGSREKNGERAAI